VLQSWDILLPYFAKKRNEFNQLFTVMFWSAVRAVGVLFILILEFPERNMPRFLDDVHSVEALNEPVDNSCSGAKLFVNMGNVFCAAFFL